MRAGRSTRANNNPTTREREKKETLSKYCMLTDHNGRDTACRPPDWTEAYGTVRTITDIRTFPKAITQLTPVVVEDRMSLKGKLKPRGDLSDLTQG